jgi:CheY-like chemotaxis protein
MLAEHHRSDPVLAGRKVLVVDDDVRNIFALTSVLESYNMQVLHAENGKEGIELLQSEPGVEAVLMDIMMPEMDGYEAIAAIRQMDEFKQLPIIALTAKAMKADRDHCLEVGASDYISKPLDIDQLLSLLRVWLYRQVEN